MMYALLNAILPEEGSLPALLRDWGEDTRAFLRHDVPKLALVIVSSLILIRLLRLITGKVAALQTPRIPSGLSSQQVRTLASVINSVGVFIILFWALLQALPLLGFELGPLLRARVSPGWPSVSARRLWCTTSSMVFSSCWRTNTT